MRDEHTAGETKVEEEAGLRDERLMVDRCRAYYNEITQGEGGVDIAVCLTEKFPSTPQRFL